MATINKQYTRLDLTLQTTLSKCCWLPSPVDGAHSKYIYSSVEATGADVLNYFLAVPHVPTISTNRIPSFNHEIIQMPVRPQTTPKPFGKCTE